MRLPWILVCGILLAGCTTSPEPPRGLVKTVSFEHEDARLVAARVQGACECAPSVIFVFADDRALLVAVEHGDPKYLTSATTYDPQQFATLLNAVDWRSERPTGIATVVAAEPGWQDALAGAWAPEDPSPGVACMDASRTFFHWEESGALTMRAWSCESTSPYARLLDQVAFHAWGPSSAR